MGVTTPAPPKSRYSLGSAKNLVLSLAAVVGMVLVLIMITPRVSSVSGPPVDVHAAAVDVKASTDWPIVEAVGLPEGWSTTSARFVRTTDSFSTWHAGYQTPSGTYVAVEQTMDPTSKWVEAQTNRAPKKGTLEAGGPGGRTPILALTANTLVEDRYACFESGMDGFLIKPLDREKLAEALAGLVASRHIAA